MCIRDSHHPDRDIMFFQQLDLCLRVLESPIQIVQLNLAELHVLTVGVQESLHHIIAAMDGKAQVADTAGLPLLHEIFINTVFRI